MTKPEIFRVAAGALTALVGVALGVAAAQLWNGAPASWPDVVASEASVKSTARVIALVTAALVIAGSATAFGAAWGRSAAAIGILAFAAGGFWANVVVFGSVRPIHTIPNIIIAVIVLILLWMSR
jgi:hypothetical protein